ncbi:DUF6119 family protein [Acinetobacter soli]|uniref:DUF6119 family protein n=1 Tax=Acinetobacter soli TaxID=487316 RepID=UPI0004688512|nr:DUF6119 family protein [Acinetobacter soli]
MGNTYNIYRIKNDKYDDLLNKIESVGLVEQKTQTYDNYEMTFYFSEEIEGNDIWWFDTYKNFFNTDAKSLKNIFYFALLLCKNLDNPKEIYAVSLGKSHFYLSKFIESDFGINLAVRMGDEKTTILKKSRYFTGIKRHEVSSYENFTINSYESGESVEHLKIKAENQDIWGDKNIIFADSIQLNINKSPGEMAQIFDEISTTLKNKEIIRLPKLEPVNDPVLIELLNSKIIHSIVKNTSINIEEMSIYGVNICFRFNEYNYELIYKKGRKLVASSEILSTLDISTIALFVESNDINDINDIHVRFKIEESGRFTRPLKDLLDFHYKYEEYNYFLKTGKWFKFNETFTEYLKKSLEQLEIYFKEDLLENDYLIWRAAKQSKIEKGEEVDDKITYREYYFNLELSKKGYELLDRQLKLIQSLDPKGKKYKVEVADLYKDNEIISVKISNDPQELIYNIEQSKSSLELVKQGLIPFDYDVTSAALWLALEKPISSIIEINSIQFLLALDAWKKHVEFFKLKPRIYISRHIK